MEIRVSPPIMLQENLEAYINQRNNQVHKKLANRKQHSNHVRKKLMTNSPENIVLSMVKYQLFS